LNRNARDVVAVLERLGYEYDRTNTKQTDYWIRGTDEVALNPSISEHHARQLIRRLERADGVCAPTNKRNPDAIRARQEKQRNALREQLARDRAERDVALAERDRYLGGLAREMTNKEIRAIEARITEREHELRDLERLMAAPSLNNDARHRAG